jgi:DNA-binding transcriptional LysR family regulator
VVQSAAAQGPIRVSAPQELGRMLIAPWAATFLDRHPDVSLDLGISDRFVDIIREGFDIAIRMGSLADSDLVSRKIGDIRFVLAASPDYISRNRVPPILRISVGTSSCAMSRRADPGPIFSPMGYSFQPLDAS